ncbi:MAG: hypothetical protein HW391_1985, partial [Chloroflexi bacterium]|nr:hypothetical protein [Chloroflexota bacterium]
FGHAFPNPALHGETLRVAAPPTPHDAARLEIRVRPQDLDPMAHVNNAVYLDWIEEAVAAAGDSEVTTATPRRVAIEYAASAEAGDALEARAWPESDGWWVRIVRPADGSEVVRGRLGPLPAD